MSSEDRNDSLTYEEFIGIQKVVQENDKNEVMDMYPTSIKHDEIVKRLNDELNKYFQDTEYKVYSRQGAILIKINNIQRQFTPDVFVIKEEAIKKDDKFINPPKIIFEVISKQDGELDYFIKARLYQRFGVLEYNIVEPNGHIVQYKLNNNKYNIDNTYKNDDIYKSVVFEDLTMDLLDIF